MSIHIYTHTYCCHYVCHHYLYHHQYYYHYYRCCCLIVLLFIIIVFCKLTWLAFGPRLPSPPNIPVGYQQTYKQYVSIILGLISKSDLLLRLVLNPKKYIHQYMCIYIYIYIIRYIYIYMYVDIRYIYIYIYTI